jgi:sterol desaturase/sphingolipid hydroxylase (fatty acid hydroxylase superfamily)
MEKLTHNYFFWLIIFSFFCMGLEHIKPWRKQKIFRKQFIQDIFWMVLNLYLFGLIFSKTINFLDSKFLSFITQATSTNFKGMLNFSNFNLFYQICLGMIIKDFFEWLIHNLLHRISFLWKIHQLHHSIKTMDWLGNTRFHLLEIVVYKTLKYIPLLLLNFTFEAVLIIDLLSTLIGHLNHSNIKLNIGPLQYIFNSPNMHIWHHDKINHFKNGQNFGIVFSFWDYIFKTAYSPLGQPNEIGFNGEEKYPDNIGQRLLWPFIPQK